MVTTNEFLKKFICAVILLLSHRHTHVFVLSISTVVYADCNLNRTRFYYSDFRLNVLFNRFRKNELMQDIPIKD